VVKKLIFEIKFKNFYANADEWLKDKIDKQLRFLLQNPRHPSLRLRKKKGTKYYLADIDYFYRLILKIEKDTCYVIDVGPHDIERKY